MVSFLVSVILLTATPGPGVLSVAGVGAAFGAPAGLRYLFGVFIGTNAVALLAASGLAALMMAQPGLRLALTILSVTYLGWLAFRIARQGDRLALTEHARPPGIRSGVTLQVLNPKCHAVNLSLFSGFTLFDEAVWVEIATKFLLINAVWVPVHVSWLAAGAGLAKLDLSAGWRRALNLGMAATMLAAVLLALLSG